MDSAKKTSIAAVSIALFWVVLGVLLCYGATRLGVGSATDPGTGFIFFWSGLILIALSLIAFAESLRDGEDTNPEIGALNWRKIVFVLFGLVLYAYFLERLGFVVTTFLLLSFLLGLIEDTNWGKSLGISSATALGSYVVFELWLKIRLPHGIFSF